MTEFDRILDDAFSRLQRGESVEAVLSRHPAQVEALAPLLEMAALSLYAYTYSEPASRAGRARGRQRLLAEAAARADQHGERARRSLSLGWLWPARRWAVTAAALLAFFLVAGTGAVVASAGSLPGELLYPVKLAVEDAQLALTRAPEQRARLRMVRAERRDHELTTLLARQEPFSRELLLSGLSEAESALRELSQVPLDERRPSLSTFIGFALTQAARLEELHRQTQPAQQPLLADAVARYRQLAELAQAGQANPDLPAPAPGGSPIPPTALPPDHLRPTATPGRPATTSPTANAAGGGRPATATPEATGTRPPRRPTPTAAATRRAPTQPASAPPDAQPTRRPAPPSLRHTPTPAPTGRPPRVSTAVPTTRPHRATATPTESVTPSTGVGPRPTVTPTATGRPHRRPSPTPTPTEHARPSPTPAEYRRPSPTPTERQRPPSSPTPRHRPTAQPTAPPPIPPRPTPTP